MSRDRLYPHLNIIRKPYLGGSKKSIIAFDIERQWKVKITQILSSIQGLIFRKGARDWANRHISLVSTVNLDERSKSQRQTYRFSFLYNCKLGLRLQWMFAGSWQTGIVSLWVRLFIYGRPLSFGRMVIAPGRIYIWPRPTGLKPVAGWSCWCPWDAWVYGL